MAEKSKVNPSEFQSGADFLEAIAHIIGTFHIRQHQELADNDPEVRITTPEGVFVYDCSTDRITHPQGPNRVIAGLALTGRLQVEGADPQPALLHFTANDQPFEGNYTISTLPTEAT